MNKLLIRDAGENFCVELNKNQFIIGRLGECDITLKSNSISRNHAKIFLKETMWFLEDLNSTNGVYVNNTKIDSMLALMHKDIIKIGESVIEFVDEEFLAIDDTVNDIAATFHKHSKSVKPVTLKEFLKGVNEIKNKMSILASSMAASNIESKRAAEQVKQMASGLGSLIKGYINSGVSTETSATLVHGMETRLKYDGISQMFEAAVSKDRESGKAASENTDYIFALDEIKVASENVSDYKKSSYLILSIAMKILGLNRGFIIIKDPASGAITPIVSRIDKNDMNESSPSMSVAKYSISKNYAVFIDDPALDPRFADKSRSIISGVIKSVICVPLSKNSICLGAIYLDSDEQKKNFNDFDRDFVIKLAGHISELLEVSGLFHELISEYEGIDEILTKLSKKSELEDLLKKIVMADVKTKISAIEKVSLTTDEHINSVLKENLAGEENRFLIATYIKIIGTIAKENDIDFIKKYLLHPDARVRANSIGALLNMNARERVLDKIVKMVSDEDAKVRALASHYILSMNHNLIITEFGKYFKSSSDSGFLKNLMAASFLLSLDNIKVLYLEVFAGLDDELKSMAVVFLKGLNNEKASLILDELLKTAGASYLKPAEGNNEKSPVPIKPVLEQKHDIKSSLKTSADSVQEIKREVREKVDQTTHSYESEENIDDDIMSEFQSALQRVNESAKSENRMKSIMYQLKAGKKR